MTASPVSGVIGGTRLRVQPIRVTRVKPIRTSTARFAKALTTLMAGLGLAGGRGPAGTWVGPVEEPDANGSRHLK